MTLRFGLGCVLAVSVLQGGAWAQELEPRAYSPNPTGANFVLLGLVRTTGDVVFDASLPFRNVSAKVNGTTLLYGRTFGLFGRSASAGLGVPYAWGSVQGEVAEAFRRITRSGLADARLRLAVNLVGGPAMKPADFVKRRPRTTLGTSLLVQVPTGQYDGTKLINLSTHRWSFKPELGVSHPLGRFDLDFYAGAWLFTTNDDFYGGQVRKQDPIGTLQAHVSYTFRPRLWLAADATFYTGGRTTIDGQSNDDLQQNSRIGLTGALPLGRRHSLKVSWASGFTTRVGGDFQTLAVAWQYLWFDRAKQSGRP